MAGKLNLTYKEYGTQAKTSQVGVWIPTLVTGNIVAQNGLMDDLVAAIADVTLGVLQKDQRVASESNPSNAAATDVHAQRENKWHVSMTETGTGNPVSIEIPCADLALLAADGESMDTGSAEYTALVAAIEAVAKSNDGNAVTVDRIYFVGRSI